MNSDEFDFSMLATKDTYTTVMFTNSVSGRSKASEVMCVIWSSEDGRDSKWAYWLRERIIRQI